MLRRGSVLLSAVCAALALAASALADTPPLNTSPPTVDGTAEVDQTLHGSPGTWSGSPAPTFAYQWQDCTATAYRDAVLADAPTAYWRLGESAPATSAVDETVNHFNGTYTNAPTLGAAALLTDDPSTAVTFDGVNDVVTTSLTNTAAQLASFTIEAWIKKSGAPTGLQAVVGTAGATAQALVIPAGATTAQLRFWNGSAFQTVSTAQTVVDGAPHHLVGTWDGLTLRIYRDGVLSASSTPTGTPAASTSGMSIGAFTATSSQFAGTIDEPAFYRSALSAARVQAHYLTATGDCQNVSGATSQDYKVASSDRGKRVRVSVTGTNAAGSATAASGRTSMVPLDAPANDSQPTMSGTFEQGQTITGSVGQWSGAQPITYTYQWSRCGERNAVLSLSPVGYWRLGELSGTTAADATGHGNSGTYLGTPTLGNQGALNADPDTGVLFDGVRTGVNLTGSYPTGHAPATVAAWVKPSGFPPAGVYATIVGFGTQGLRIKMNQGGTLVVQTPVATNVSSTVLTSGTWAHLAAVDDGTAVTLYVNGVAVKTWATAGGNKVAGFAGIGVNNGAEWFKGTIDEAAIFSSALTATQVGNLYDAAFTENSLSGCSAISGATGSSYTTVAADEGSKLEFTVTATNSIGTASATSDTKVIRSPGPDNVGLPSISGTPVSGQTLTATSGDWNGAGTISYAYQWKRCGYQDAVLADAPAGYWRFGEQSNSIAADSSGSNHGGQYSGATTSSMGAISGEGDGALTGGSVVIPGIGTLASGPPFSIETWFKPSSDDLATNTKVATGYGWTLSLVDVGTTQTNVPQFDVEKYDSVNMISTHGTATGNVQLTSTTHWYHLVGVYTGSAINLFVDGTQVATVGFSGNVRHDTTGNITFWTTGGSVDEGAWYRAPLTSTQVTTHLNAVTCTAIAGATSSTYPVVAGDAGKRLAVTVTATNFQGSSAASSPTIQIAGSGAPINTAKPTITDDKNTVGDALTATPGSWSSSSAVSYAYQWQRCNYAATVLADHPVGYWPLDEVAGPNGDDASGNANGGSYQGTPVFGVDGALGGSLGSAVRMNGSSGDLVVPVSASLHMGQTFSVEAWVKLNAGGGGQLFKQPEGFALTVHTNEIILYYAHFVSGDPVVNPMIADSTTGVPVDGQWHHVVAEKAGNVGFIYLDGADVTTAYADQGVGSSPSDVTLGNLSADVDEAAVYPSRLTTARVQAHYAAGQQPCADISGASGTGYTLAAADVGDTVRAKVTATNTGGSASAASLPTLPVVQQGGLELDLPEDGAVVRTTTPALSVVPVSGTDPTDYEFELASDPGFNSGSHNSGWLPSTSTYAVPASWQLKDGKVYFWHARTRSSTGAISPWKGPRSFKVQLKMLGVRPSWPIWSHDTVAVNEINGNLVLAAPTPGYPTAAGTMGTTLTYNSVDTADNGLGRGWTTMSSSDFAHPPSSLTDLSSIQAAEVRWADGSSDVFSQVGTSSVFAPPPGDSSRLSKNPDGTWAFVDADGTMYTFGVADATTGQAALTGAQVDDTTGTRGKLTYTFGAGGTKLTRVSDAAGRQVTVNWKALTSQCTGALICVSGPDGLTWRYVGDGVGGTSGKLARINDGVRDVMAFTYDAQNRLATIKNADDLNPGAAGANYNAAHSIQIAYDASGRVASITEGPITNQVPSTSTWSFVYHPGQVNTAPTRADHVVPAPTDKNPDATKVLPAGSVRVADGYTDVVSPSQQGAANPAVMRIFYDDFNHPIEGVDSMGGINESGFNLREEEIWVEDLQGRSTDYSYQAVTEALTSVTKPDPDGAGPLPALVSKTRFDESKVGTASAAGAPLEGLQGAYYANANLSGLPVARRTDPTINYLWGSGGPSVLDVSDNFSVRWTGLLSVSQTGDYILSTKADSGVSLVVDGMAAISDWRNQDVHVSSSQLLHLRSGLHRIQLDYFEATGSAQVSLRWRCGSCATPIATQTVPSSALRPNWLNQTSMVTASGKLVFEHFASPAFGHPDYELIPVGGTNLVTSFKYDGYGRLLQKVQPKGNLGRTIEADGSLSGAPDPRFATSYSYYADGETAAAPAACGGGAAIDQAGQLKTMTPYGITGSTTIYDSGGRPVALTDGRGTLCSTFDGEGRLTSQQAAGDAGPTTYTYDPAGRQLSINDSSGLATFAYDESGRLVRSVDTLGAETTFSYDTEGNLVLRKASAGPQSSNPIYTTQYGYTVDGDLTHITDPAGKSYDFYYNEFGDLRAEQLPNGTFSWHDYNAAGWLTAVYNRHGQLPAQLPSSVPADSTGSPLVDFTYTYNVDAQRTAETRSGGGIPSQTTTYAYDSLQRMSDVTFGSGLHRVYNYDADSNRTSVTETPAGGSTSTVASYAYNPSSTPGVDQLTSVTQGGSTTSYTYNTSGQVTSRGSDTMSWDGWGRMTGGTFGGTAVTYAYDSLNRLRSRVSAGKTTKFMYAGTSSAALFQTDAAGTIQSTSVEGAEGALAQYLGAPVSGTPAVYLYYNAHGDVAAQADALGSRTATYTYDPFGAVSGQAADNSMVSRFTGQWSKLLDTSTGLVQMGARAYDPLLGRFLSVDPVDGGSLNAYEYALQDPINAYDLGGTLPCPPVACHPIRFFQHAIAKIRQAVGGIVRAVGRGLVWTGEYVYHTGRRTITVVKAQIKEIGREAKAAIKLAASVTIRVGRATKNIGVELSKSGYVKFTLKLAERADKIVRILARAIPIVACADALAELYLAIDHGSDKDIAAATVWAVANCYEFILLA